LARIKMALTMASQPVSEHIKEEVGPTKMLFQCMTVKRLNALV